MKKQIKDREDEAVRYIRQQCLLRGNPDEMLNTQKKFGIHHEETLGHTIKETAKFIEHCYDFNFSPLTHLRWYYVEFGWEFLKPKDETTLADALLVFDYVWPKGSLDWSFGMVGAIWKPYGRRDQRRHICYCPSQLGILGHEPDIDFWPVAALKANGIRVFAAQSNQFL